MDYGIALYSIHDVMKEGIPKAVDEAKRMGYDFVEPVGSFDSKPQQLELKEALDRNGLPCNSIHTMWTFLAKDKIANTVDMLHTIGCNDFVIPVFFPQEKQDVAEFLKTVNDAQKILASEGIKIHYHNHLHEVYENKFGIKMLDTIRDFTDINFEIDTYWAFEGYIHVLADIKGHIGTAKDYEIKREYIPEAGAYVLRLMEELKDRVDFIHLRDGDGFSTPMPLGYGIAPLYDIYAKARDLGFGIMYEGEPFGHGIDSAEKSIKTIKEYDQRYEAEKTAE